MLSKPTYIYSQAGKILCCLGIVCLHINNTFGQQNLIPNPSFEEIIGCPTDSAGGNVPFFVTIDWNLFNTPLDEVPQYILSQGIINALQYGSPDLLHGCVPPVISGFQFGYKNGYGTQPDNLFGHQYPHTGDAYVHIAYEKGNSSSTLGEHEVIFIRLKEALKPGQGYCGQYYWSRAEGSGLIMQGPQVMFTQALIPYAEVGSNLFYEPQIRPLEVFTDTANWNVFNFEFVAQGGEKYIHIGWFRPMQEMQVQDISSENDAWFQYFGTPGQDPTIMGNYHVSMYLDDISLIECDELGQSEEDLIFPNIFSPNGDGINDEFELHPEFVPPGCHLAVYNRWGELVYENLNYQNEWDGASTTAPFGSAQGAPLVEGTYFGILRLPSGKVLTQTITLVR